MVNMSNSTAVTLIQDGDFWGLFTQAFTDLLGIDVFAAIGGLLLMLVIYIYSGSVVVPTILALFLSASVAVFLPPTANYVMYVFLALAISGIIYRLYKGGTQY